MKNRCKTAGGESFRLYTSRGIKVCARWQSFENFLADMGERPHGRTLDRIDNNGNYEPANCRWATPKEQMRNFRRNRLITIGGVTKPMIVWCEENGINYNAAKSRITTCKWDAIRAVTQPVMTPSECGAMRGTATNRHTA